VTLAILLAVAAGLCVLRMLVYRQPGPDGVLELAWPAADVARYRWTPLLAGAIVGTSLGVSGVLLQALLRNPLASPFILGVSGGAALGVVVAMYIGWVAGATGPWSGGQTVPALIGAIAVLAVVYGLGQRRGWIDPVSLILIGVIVATICGAGIMLFQHLVPHGLRSDLVVWMMGHIPQAAPPTTLVVGGGLSVLGVVAGTALGRRMDAATLSDDEARTVGLALGRLRVELFVLAGALAAAAVAIAGPIGFVGLVAPHAARILLGPRHGPLVLGAALCGVVLIVGADAGRQVISPASGRIPVGVITALVGGPAFIWLLRSGRGQA
jgi:iron complex transport system permease protein